MAGTVNSVRERALLAFSRLLSVSTLVALGTSGAARAGDVKLLEPAPPLAIQARPPVKDLDFFIYNPSGKDLGKELNGVAALHSKRGGRFFVGKANGAVLDQVVRKGLAPTYLANPAKFDAPAGAAGGVGPLAADPDPDTDGDGLTDIEEARYKTDPNNPDTDQDFLSDGDEVHVHGTWPLKESTDGDRYDDGQEVLGYSPAGLGALGGDMPGYVLAPGDQPLIAAYPKIDFEVRDGVEMQPREQVTIGTKTITTETKAKTTTQRSLDVVTVGKAANTVAGNQRVDDPQLQAEVEARASSQTPSAVAAHNVVGAEEASMLISTAHGTVCEVGDEATCSDIGSLNSSRLSALGGVISASPGPCNGLYPKDLPDPVRTADISLVHQLDEAYTMALDPLECGLYERVAGPSTLQTYVLDYRTRADKLSDVVGLVSFGVSKFTGWLAKSLGAKLLADVAPEAFSRGLAYIPKNQIRVLEDAYVSYLEAGHPAIQVDFLRRSGCGIDFQLQAMNPGSNNIRPECQSNSCIRGLLDWQARCAARDCIPGYARTLPETVVQIHDSSIDDWNVYVEEFLRPLAKGTFGRATAATTDGTINSILVGRERLTPGPFEVGARLDSAISDFGSGLFQKKVGDQLFRSPILDDPESQGETARPIPISRTSLRETIVTEKYSWSVTKEDWQSVTTDSTDFGTVTFSFNVRNTGTDIAKDASGLRFNLYIGDNPATPEVENFNPITFPSIQNPAITFQNVAPGDESLFGATVHLAKQQFRALDEGASLKIAVADYSYGSDELYYRSAAGGGVRFLIDNGVRAAAAARYEEFLIPVAKVWDETLGILREPTYGELLAKAVPVEHQDGILRSINGRAIGGSAWWSMMLTKATDASLFYRSTAVKGQTVRLEYHGDADTDGYADAVELEKGTDPDDATAHPSPVIIGALHESPDPANPGWTIGRFKVTNTGTYEAYGMEARIYATDADVEITDALVGGSGLVKPGETFDHPDDVFRYRSTSGRKPLLEIRYNDPTGLKIHLSTVTIPSLTDDISGLATQMRSKVRITAEAPETFFYDVPQRLTVGYANPTTTTIRNAVVAVDWQSLMGDILKHDSRTIALPPGTSFALFEFKPQDHLSPANIGGRFKALVRILDHNGALIDSRVAPMVLSPRRAEMSSEGAPRLSVSGSPWNVGTVTRGTEVRHLIVLANAGTSTLEASLSTTSSAVRFTGATRLALAPGEQANVPVVFDSAPLPAGAYSASIILGSNDPVTSLVAVPVTATLVESTAIVSLFPVEGRPWERRVFIRGSYPAGTRLFFEHDISGEPERVIPLLLFDASRTVTLAHSEENSIPNATLRRTGATERQCELVLPNDVIGGASFYLQFGKKVAHDFVTPLSFVLSARVPHDDQESASLALWHSAELQYDEFSDGVIDDARWATTPPAEGVSIAEAGGEIRLQTTQYVGTGGTWTATSTVDMKALGIDILECRVSDSFLAQYLSPDPLVFVKIGGATIEQYDTEFTPFRTIPAHLLRLVFDRLNQSVAVYRDGAFVGTVDLSLQATWKLSFGVYRHIRQQSASTGMDWVRMARSGVSHSLRVGDEHRNVWQSDTGPFAWQEPRLGTTMMRSPDIAEALNASLAGLTEVDGQSDVPLFTHVNYQGWTLLTDFVLMGREVTNRNLRAIGVQIAASVAQEEPVRLELSVRNDGDERVPACTCVFYLLGEGAAGEAIAGGFVGDGIDPGEEGPCVGEWVPSNVTGDQVIVGVVDPANHLAETDETDNEARAGTRVLRPSDLSVSCGAAVVSPSAPVLGQLAWISTAVSNSGERDVPVAVLEVFDGNPETGGLLIGRAVEAVPAGSAVTTLVGWVPTVSGSHTFFGRVATKEGPPASGSGNSSCSVGSVRVTSSSSASPWMDCGDGGAFAPTDLAYSQGVGYGYLDGSAEVTWGTLPWQSYRYGFGGVVRYRFDNLSPAATYHLDSTFYEGDGVGRTVEVWVDGENTGKAESLAGGQIHRLSVTLPKTAYSSDGSVVVEFRRQGPGDVLVNALSLRQVGSWYVDSGDGGVTDVAFTAERGYGFLNGSASTAWGTSAAQSIRYGLTGDVKYRFTNLDPTKRYRASATLLEADGQGRVEQLEVDGFAIGAPLALSAAPQVASGLVPASAYASDRSVDVRIARTNGSQAVVSEVRLEEETLPVRTLADSSVTPAAGSGSTAFTWEVVFTDLDGAFPDAVTVTIDGTPHPMAATDPAVTDTRRGRRYAYSATGLSNGLHSYSFSATVAGEAATGDVLPHVGPLVGGPGLPDTGAWGLIPGGDSGHPSEVLYAFGSATKPLRLGFEVYDVDTAAEVEVFLNGTSLGSVPVTADGQWGGAQELILPLSALRASGGNQLAFRNTVNQPSGSEPWGVRNVSLLAERPEGLVVEDVPADDGTALLLRWTRSVDDGAGLGNVLGYRVYRATSPAGPFALVHTAAPGQELWVDAGATTETKYWYQVAAFNGLQNSSTPLMESAVPLDNRAPAVLGASPDSGATGVPPGTPIVLHLVDTGRGVDETAVDFRVNGAYVNPTLTGTPADLTATIVPPALPAGTSVTVTLSAADLATPANRLEGWSLSYTTGVDTTPPYLSMPSPGSGATGVDPNVVLSVQVRDDGSGVDASSVVLRVNGIQVTPTLGGSGGAVSVSFDPPSAFAAGQVVTVAVSARDLAPVPNVLSGSWSFTVSTGGEGPVVTSSSPEGATTVLLGATVPFVVTTQDDTLDLTTVTWRVDGAIAKTGTTFNGSGGGDWTAWRPIALSGGATAYTDEQVSVALGTRSTTPGDYLVFDDFASLAPAWTGFNTTPAVSGGTLNLSAASCDLSGSVDTYKFVYQAPAVGTAWTTEVQATCTNDAASDGCGLLVKADADNWYFVGQTWDAGLNADAVTFRFQTGGMSMVNLPVAAAASTVHLRFVKTGNLLHASWRPNTSTAWTALGAAPIFAVAPQVGVAAWETTATALAASFDTFRLANGSAPPVTTSLTGAKSGFSDIRITEENGATETLVPTRLTDTDFDGVSDTATFPADATAANTWKTYRVYYGNPLAADLSTTTLPGANAFAEPAPVIGSATAVTGSSFSWTATPTGARTIEAQASDGTSSDYRTFPVTVLPATPSAPTGLTATPDDGKVHLGWVASSAANVAGYHVYRDGARVTTAPVARAAYTDAGLPNGVSRCWTVRAVSPGAVESPDSASACAGPRDRLAPAAPVGLAVAPGNASAQLSWYPGWAPDLAGYKVYRKLGSGTTFAAVTPVPVVSPAHLDQPLANGTAYDWAVSSVDTSGNESGLSAVVTGTPRVPPPVELSIGDAVVLEGNTGTREAVFAVTLSRAPGATVSASFTTAAGTATSGTDFVPASGSVTFAAHETLKTVTVLVNGDALAEESETFFVNLSGVSGAVLADGEGMGTILNDDVAIPSGERSALIALYEATAGSGWTTRTGWRNGSNTDYGAAGTECAWHGVTCDATGTHVVGLALSSNHLVGPIPLALGSLPALRTLDLRSNQLSGSIPASLGSLAALRTLDLGSNGGLTGPLPASLGALANLERLVLKGNQLDGAIPAELGGLPALTTLDLSANRLTGTLPAALGQLANLELLDVGFNLFAAGPVPEWLQGLTKLKQLGLSATSRTGTLPAWLGTMAELRTLAVDGNSLEGFLPSALGGLAKLEQLQIGGNAFTGSIPGTFANLTSLAGSASELRWNGVQTSDGALRAFLNSKQRQGGDWEGTQTIAPTNVGALSATQTSVSLAWSPIAYTADAGGYEVHVASQPGGPYTLVGTTTDKSVSAGVVDGLLPGRTYYFVVRSKTGPHAFNLNTVTSLASAEVSATTPPCTPPPTPAITAPPSVAAGSSFLASVPDHAGSTYAWTVTGGSVAAGQGSHEVSITAAGTGTLVVRVVETDSLGCASAEASADVAVVGSVATKFHPLAPCRALDTRNASGDDAASPALDPGVVRTFDLVGRCAIPATARSLAVNVTVITPTESGDLVLYRGDLVVAPEASSISFSVGKTRANNGLLELARDASLTIKALNRATVPVHVVLDVNGYFE